MRRAHRGIAAVLMRQLVVGIAICMAPTQIYAQGDELTKEKLLAWFDAERAKAVAPPSMNGIRLSFVEVMPQATSQATLDKWRREVAGKPEHPMRPNIQLEERRMRHGPDRHEITIWYDGSQRWRLSQSRFYAGLDESYLDVARRNEERWSMLPSSLSIDETRGQSHLDRHYPQMHAYLSKVLYGSTHHGRTEDPEQRQVFLRGDAWEIRSRNANGWSWRFAGAWDPDLNRPLVTEMRERRPKDDVDWLIVQYASWNTTDAGQIVPEKIETRVRLASDYMIRSHIADVEFEHVGTSAVDGVLDTPRPGTSGPIRGEVVVVGFSDAVRGDYAEYDGEKEVSRIRDPALSIKSPSRAWIAYATAAAIVVILVAVRVRRSFMGQG